MPNDGSRGIERWEMEVAKKLVREFKNSSRVLANEPFEDLLQECLLCWIDVRRTFKPGTEGPPLAYMAKVLRN